MIKIPEELLFRNQRRLPIYMSAEGAECGLACIAMIANYHGHDVDLNGLRQRFPISMQGANLRSIIDISSKLSFTARALRIEMDELGQLELPAIIHWNLDHFVVLDKVGAKTATIHDPSSGRREIPLSEVSHNFTGIALELYPAKNFTKVVASPIIKLDSLWTKTEGLTSSLLYALTLSVALQVLAFLAPFQMQLVIDQAIPRNDHEFLALICVVFTALLVFQYTITGMRDYCLQLFGNQFVAQVTSNLVRHLLRLPSSFFEKRHVGDILSRMSSTSVIRQTLLNGTLSALMDGSMAAISAAILFFYAPRLAWVVVGSFLLILLVNYAAYPFSKNRQEQTLVATAVEQSYLMESIRAAKTIKLLGREAVRESEWRNLFIKTMNASVSNVRVDLINTYATNIIGIIQISLIIYIGAGDVIRADGFSLGMLTAFLAFRGTFMDRGLSFVRQFNSFRMLRLQLERLSDIISQEIEVQSDQTYSLDVKGDVRFEDVSFRYGSTDNWIFRGQSFSISAGDFVAIVGPSGGGKSTLLKLLLGLQVPDNGKIILDGHVANPQIVNSWRGQAGIVLQDDNLLSGSLANNIASFDPDMDMEKVFAAARAAQIHEEIKLFPMQYNTLVGDMGSTLSGGQRQRVLLARALYRDPKILILDEGTANLDPANETAIADIIQSLPITKIVVAHRANLISRAKKIITVKNGEVTTEQVQ